MREWVRITRETKGAITWEMYLQYPFKHRYFLHKEVESLLDEIDAQYESSKKGA